MNGGQGQEVEEEEEGEMVEWIQEDWGEEQVEEFEVDEEEEYGDEEDDDDDDDEEEEEEEEEEEVMERGGEGKV